MRLLALSDVDVGLVQRRLIDGRDDRTDRLHVGCEQQCFVAGRDERRLGLG